MGTTTTRCSWGFVRRHPERMWRPPGCYGLELLDAQQGFFATAPRTRVETTRSNCMHSSSLMRSWGFLRRHP
eukprot:2868525-Amphidinium_carterae.1